MHHTKLQELLQKNKEGTISEEEMALLENWYAGWHPEARPLSHEEIEASKLEVWQSIQQVKKPVIRRQLWPRLTAAISLFLFFSLLTYYFSRTSIPQKADQAKINAPAKIDFTPGGNKAVLSLAGGKRILLTNAGNGQLAVQGAVTIVKTADGEVMYDHQNGAGRTQDDIYNTMSTPRGGQYNLTLADGTKVWLNAASSITYPVAFSGAERKVAVTGEAYFEVAHEKSKPFIVQTNNQEIRVLGTHFNVKAYDDDAGISTTLLAGSVQIKNLSSGKSEVLKPGQQAKVFKDQPQISIKAVNAEDFISWKNGYFIFDNQSIKSVMKIMSRWYDVDVVYDNLNREDKFGGTFSRASNLSEILHNLEQVGKIHFKMEARKVIVRD